MKIFIFVMMFLLSTNVYAWNNGQKGDANTDSDHPHCVVIPYSTHDWIADHARDSLPKEDRKWLDDNKKLYLLGTEAPDNSNIPDSCNSPNNGYDDRRQGHSVVINTNNQQFFVDRGGKKHDRAAVRALDEYRKACGALIEGRIGDAAYYAGAMAHYVGDIAQYGHVMKNEKHHGDYEGLVSRRTQNFDHDFFEIILRKYESFVNLDAYETAEKLAVIITNGNSEIKSAIWMSDHYNDRTYKYWSSVNASLNLGVNAVNHLLRDLTTQCKM